LRLSHLPRANWGEVEPTVQKVFESYFESRGNVPNLFRVLAHRPTLLRTFQHHFGAVMGEGEVSVLFKELLAVRVSQLNACRY
jgi:alkylhydroperoxidase family enzyme